MGVAVDPKNPVGGAVNLKNTEGVAVDPQKPMCSCEHLLKK
jgi:hypothetical protein